MRNPTAAESNRLHATVTIWVCSNHGVVLKAVLYAPTIETAPRSGAHMGTLPFVTELTTVRMMITQIDARESPNQIGG